MRRRTGVLALVALGGGPAAAQVPGLPLSAPANARSSSRVLFTASIESGIFRHAAGWVVPVSARAALDKRSLAVAGGASVLRSTSGSRPNGVGLGATVALRLWDHGDSYKAFGGRAVAGAAWSRFTPDVGPAVWQLDLPVALSFAHRLPPPGLSILPWIAPRLQPRLLHVGSTSEWRLLAGASAGVELVTIPGGWGFRLAFELVGDVGGGPLEGGVTLGGIRKFF